MAAEILNLQLWVSDYDFVKDLTMQESVNSWAVFLNGAHISMQSKNALLYNFIGDGSRIGCGNSMCAGYVIFDTVDGVDWDDGQEANCVDSG